MGVPIIRTIVYWGLYWGPLIVGNYHMDDGHARIDEEEDSIRQRLPAPTVALGPVRVFYLIGISSNVP